MVKKNIILFFTLFCTISFSQESYYDNVDLTLTGTQLKNALATKITTTHTKLLFYTPDVWEASKVTDSNPSNSNEVILIYGWEDGSDGVDDNDRTRDKNLQDSGNGATFVWNREHVFPRSLANPAMTTDEPGAGTDAHHLRPADRLRNSARNNLKFGDGSGNSGFSSDTYTGPSGPNTNAWYPGDEWKGDVARMIMYMYVRYGDQCLPSAVGVGSSQFTPDDMIDLFLTWNIEDPVSDFEKTRNTYHENTANTYAQGNRNPFVDNPHLATRIWGGDSAQDTWGIYTNGDTEAPSVPTNITLQTITTSSINISWTAATDNIAVTSYNVYVNGTLTAQTSNTNTTIYNLTPNTSYGFSVSAKDFANNQSSQSTVVNGTTLQDTEAPSLPTNITTSNITDSSFKIMWSAATDDTEVAGYNIYLDGTFYDFTTELVYTITGLSSSTLYGVTLQTKDTSNNLSSKTNTTSITTTDGNSNNGVTELFFSEYVEGSGNNKAIEIVNLTSLTINLSRYEVKRQGNGAGDWITPIRLDSGSITSIVPNDVFVLINGNADNSTLINEADIVIPNTEDSNYGAPINFNGNDPVGLFKDGVLIDIIGTFNGGSADFAKDITLRRKSNILEPNTTFTVSEWETFPQNTVGDIGSHTSTLSTENVFFKPFKMFPNPVSGNTIFFDTNKKVSVVIYTILGELIQKKNISATSKNIDISKLNKGVYFVKIRLENQVLTKKLIRH